MTDVEKLAQIIKDNPGAIAIIDDECWHLEAPQPDDYDKSWDDEQRYYFDEHRRTIARSYDFPKLGDKYGYGLLEAMALLTNVTIKTYGGAGSNPG